MPSTVTVPSELLNRLTAAGVSEEEISQEIIVALTEIAEDAERETVRDRQILQASLASGDAGRVQNADAVHAELRARYGLPATSRSREEIAADANAVIARMTPETRKALAL